jgi:hypothetical protein
MLNTDWSLQAGIGYADVGFMRTQKNIQYRDYMYPGIGTGPNGGRLLERSNSEKHIEYNYRFQYIQIPILFNYQFRNKRDLFFSFSATAGLSINVLADHRITANLINFSVEGESRYSFDSTGYNARVLGANLLLGGRLDYKFDKQFSVMVQPFFAVAPVAITGDPASVYPVWYGVNVGVLYHLKIE